MATISTLRPLLAATLTFEDLCQREPGLAQLEAEIRAFARTPLGDDWCANARWYGYGQFRGASYRARLIGLVGWCARSPDPLLGTSLAYQLAYDALYRLLPDCRRCLCARWENGELVP